MLCHCLRSPFYTLLLTPVTLSKDGRTLSPFVDIKKLARGEMTAEQWAAQCAAVGIGERSLA